MEIVEATGPAPLPGSRYWYESDGLDSIVALTDKDGDLATPYLYDEYGQMLAGTTDLQLFTYTAQDYDPETGLYHFYARYYDPARGVWLTQDVWRGDMRRTATLNRYEYVEGRPTTLVDVHGRWPLGALAGAIVAGGRAINAITSRAAVGTSAGAVVATRAVVHAQSHFPAHGGGNKV